MLLIQTIPTRVNSVDVIYAAMPLYLYLNPSILGYLLKLLFEYQESDPYQSSYAARDLGKGRNLANGNELKLLS